MEFRNLRAFVEVVRQGGFTPAAKALFATQSTISKAVRQLEDEIGLPLLDRIGHRSHLTAPGEVVYRRAVKLLAEREDLARELDEIRGLKQGSLSLGLPPVASSALFAPLFAIYRQRFPGIDVRLVEHGSDRLEEMLRTGEIEMAASLLPFGEDFEWQGVRREPLMAVMPRAHALAGRRTIKIEDVREEPFILFEAGFGLNRIIGDACRRHGFSPAVAARSSQIEFIVGLAAAGLGIAFLPQIIAPRSEAGRAASVLLDEPETAWHIAIIWRRGAYLSHAARAWLALVEEMHPDQARAEPPQS
ncbi:LysR family transcriptional regulator [Afifella sp. H1R]|uniref:LysR family transcriptional regulator n=1 Tax=Afifella sp. H1R TaxID=2908841 RepID=UPI001F253619|nr:LysR family transcriptional regulator [Afifella sp. H1R]MCF1503564.1 LysR family transcriptional regulator [Afifella sp. H1R]